MLTTISTQRIKVADNRQRREFDADKMQELRKSIVARGLMHPIVLRGLEDGTLQLVAGERRLKAISEIHFLGQSFQCNGQAVPVGEVPYTLITALDALAAEEAELEENAVREDLTWQEKAAALKRLDTLRGKQAAEKGEVWTRSDTAEEVTGSKSGRQATEARMALAVATMLEKQPENAAVQAAAKAPSLKEAVKILQREENRQTYAAKAQEIEKVLASSKHKLLRGSCLEILPTLEADHFDLVLSDPPYGMNADQFGDSGSAGRSQGAHQYDDSYESWKSLMQNFLPAVTRVCKPQAHMYLFCDFDRFHELKGYCESAGWTVFRTPLVMQKAGQGGRVPLPNHGPRRQYELVLYAYRGQRQVRAILPDLFLSPLIESRIGHPAEKHVDALRNLLQRSAFPGDRVLDPFAGSGSIYPAGEAESVFVTGIEVDETFAGMAASRLQALDK